MLTYNITRKDASKFIINIKLTDSLFTKEWRDYMIAVSTRLPEINWNVSIGGCKVKYYQPPNVKLIEDLLYAFIFLQNSLTIDFNQEIADLEYLLKHPTELRQHHLNTWHRHFTTIATEYYSTADVEVFTKMHILNQAVHDLEESTYNYLKNIEVIKGNWISYITCTNSKEFNNKDALFAGGHELRLNDRIFNPETDKFHHTVWLGEDIQGKDQIKAWLEEDDLSANDCTGNLFMTPNLILDPHMIYATVMEQPDWQKQHLASGKPVNRFPIGDIVDCKNIDWDSLSHATVDSVILDGIVLWK